MSLVFLYHHQVYIPEVSLLISLPDAVHIHSMPPRLPTPPHLAHTVFPGLIKQLCKPIVISSLLIQVLGSFAITIGQTVLYL